MIELPAEAGSLRNILFLKISLSQSSEVLGVETAVLQVLLVSLSFWNVSSRLAITNLGPFLKPAFQDIRGTHGDTPHGTGGGQRQRRAAHLYSMALPI